MNPADLLDLRLAELHRALDEVHAPPALEGALVARFRRERRVGRPSLWWMPPLALAATLAVVGWNLRAPLPQMPAHGAAAAPAESDAGPFLALKPLERIALEPATTVIASEFPRALLAEWGLPVAPERAGEPVRAEMLYSADGEALAVRLIQ